MLEQIARWNRWGGARLNSGLPREATNKILSFIERKEVIALLGARRCGKTTIMFQIMDELKVRNVPDEAILHINCEEPFFAPQLSTDLLDQIYKVFRQKIWPTGKAYVFVDEIQNVPQWERWVRARNESEDIKIFLTGSSSKLMSRELGTLLTGRHISMTVYPLSFAESCKFRELAIESLTIHEKKHQLLEYLTWGGFPEVVLASDNEHREVLLKQYFEDILFRDISLRHNIRDVSTLRNLAVFLLTQTASLISFNRLAAIFGISVEMASHYCHYLEEAFLINLLSHYSLKTAERNRQPKKVHALDAGLRNAIALSFSKDLGRVLESAVYCHLLRMKNDGIFYINNKQEIDFALRRGLKINFLIQVAMDLGDDAVLQREIAALDKKMHQYADAKSIIVSLNGPQSLLDLNHIDFEPAHQFLLTKELPTAR
ncbi:MAG TPA: ATP-binding protein [Myxococcota bacterium]|nr:ATP-binding protein [Myxococcota bacterium]